MRKSCDSNRMTNIFNKRKMLKYAKPDRKVVDNMWSYKKCLLKE